MKKYFVLVAVALIAFAGCKKEESGMVTLTVGVENTNGVDKQTYNVDLNRIMFNQESMLVNGTECQINPLNGDNDPYTVSTNSYKAQIQAPNSLFANDFLAVYPTGCFEYGTYDASADTWTLSDPMQGTDITMICDHNTDDMGNVMLDDNYRYWPMVAYDECGECVAENGMFVMRNTVAVLSPSFIYGRNWFEALVRQYALPYDMSGITAANLPNVTINSIVITSMDQPLSGNCHVKDVKTAAPTLVMDERQGENSLTFYNCGTISASQNESFRNPNIIGQIPIAPFVGDAHLKIEMTFTIGNYRFKYTSPRPVEIAEGTTKRNERTVLQVNMRDGSAENMARFQML